MDNLVGVELNELVTDNHYKLRVAAGITASALCHISFLSSFFFSFFFTLRDGFEVNGGPCAVKTHTPRRGGATEMIQSLQLSRPSKL